MPQVSLARVKGITITFSACSLTTFHPLSLAAPRCERTFYLFLFCNFSKILFLFLSPALGRKNGEANEFQTQIGGNCDWNSLANIFNFISYIYSIADFLEKVKCKNQNAKTKDQKYKAKTQKL